MVRRCPRCRAAVRPDAGWCGLCHTLLDPPAGGRPAPGGDPGPTAAAGAGGGPAPPTAVRHPPAPAADRVPSSRRPAETAGWRCPDCGGLAGWDDRRCPGCGTGFLSSVAAARPRRLSGAQRSAVVAGGSIVLTLLLLAVATFAGRLF